MFCFHGSGVGSTKQETRFVRLIREFRGWIQVHSLLPCFCGSSLPLQICHRCKKKNYKIISFQASFFNLFFLHINSKSVNRNNTRFCLLTLLPNVNFSGLSFQLIFVHLTRLTSQRDEEIRGMDFRPL